MIAIDHEFKLLLAPLTKEEFAGLEEDILRDGCRVPLDVWRGTLIDGHNRHEICAKHGLSFEVTEREFDDRESVKTWIIRNQLNRRNQTPEQTSYYRGKLYEQMKKAGFKGNQYTESASDNNCHHQKTSDRIAEQYGVHANTIRNDAAYAIAMDTIAENVGEEVKHQILAGSLPVTKKDVVALAEKPIEEQQVIISELQSGGKPHVSNNSGNNEWYTPAEYIEAARDALNGINLDPASSPLANLTVQAQRYYTIDDDGLTREWSGRVWLNPPYASDLVGRFVSKLCECIKAGQVTEAILLVNNATETKWFQEAASNASAICFPQGRIKYLDSTSTPANTPLQGQSFVYFGDRPTRFMDIFTKFGFCVFV